jgi:hypothetical protein
MHPARLAKAAYEPGAGERSGSHAGEHPPPHTTRSDRGRERDHPLLIRDRVGRDDPLAALGSRPQRDYRLTRCHSLPG